MAMTLRLTDEETEALRERAAREGRSMQEIAREAVRVGEPAYPDLHTQAAALTHSLARNHALVDGNKWLALAGTIAFLGLNGERLVLSNDQAYDLVMTVCQGHMEEVTGIAAASRTEPH